MNLEETHVQCPCCWETIMLLVDPSVSRQEYVEDCSVCCNPLRVRIHIEDGAIHADVESSQ